MIFILTLGVKPGLTACKQEEGLGGTPSVSGKIFAYSKDTTGNPDSNKLPVISSFKIASNALSYVLDDLIIVK